MLPKAWDSRVGFLLRCSLDHRDSEEAWLQSRDLATLSLLPWTSGSGLQRCSSVNLLCCGPTSPGYNISGSRFSTELPGRCVRAILPDLWYFPANGGARQGRRQPVSRVRSAGSRRAVWQFGEPRFAAPRRHRTPSGLQYRRNRRTAGDVEVEAWLQRNHSSRDRLDRILESSAWASHARGAASGALEAVLLEYLRWTGDYSILLGRARATAAR